ncbi:hypothetical protein JOF28_000157 [Leucobacter exalbidus]|uniref:Uncharacterized protein n=1 Tax=Leucobacter exalbidus TaxID=662960 RepID=A0A940PKQ3_9MICO|nr:hypothetical protein [Leucobacter exalbidus]
MRSFSVERFLMESLGVERLSVESLSEESLPVFFAEVRGTKGLSQPGPHTDSAETRSARGRSVTPVVSVASVESGCSAPGG